ncbi:barstar family protein [Streptomyces yangpuensis]|uniref:barstar family protein n=1 Tax=Streptomyces yangpuensis TaxID=1648182 RepID=UPI003723BB0B
MHDAASVFRAFARELSFPGRFGHHGDALVDRLHTRHGPGHRDQDLAILIEHAGDPAGIGRPARHFVFLLDPTAPTCAAPWTSAPGVKKGCAEGTARPAPPS